MPGPRLVIIGGNSYIGGHLALRTSGSGWAVTAVTSKDCDFLNAGAVSRFFSTMGDEPVAIVFLAVINKHMENSFASFEANNRMARNFVEGQRHANVSSIMWFSSVDVYGSSPPSPITEETPVAPDTWYGLAKYNGEWIAAAAGEVACPVTVLRIPGIYGPGRNDRSAIGRMVDHARRESRVLISGEGRVLRDFVLLDDLARVVLELIPRRYRGVVNVATGTSHSIRDVACLLREALREDFEIVHRVVAPGREFNLCFDVRRLRSLVPGFRFTGLAEGMKGYRDDPSGRTATAASGHREG